MVQEQWLQLKMLILLGYNLEYFIEWGGGIDFWLGGNENMVGQKVYWGDFPRLG